MIELFLETLNDYDDDLTIREYDDETIFKMILNYVQSEIKSHYFFEVDLDLRDEFQINLFLVHHYKDHARHWKKDCHRRSLDLIVNVDVVREDDQMTALLHDLIVNDYSDLCRIDDDDDRRFSSWDYKEENFEFESVKICWYTQCS